MNPNNALDAAAGSISFTPTLSFLAPGDQEKIHDAVLELLETSGMRLDHPRGLEILKTAGCPIEAEGMVKIPRPLVSQALQSAPAAIPIYNRQGAPAMDLGGRRTYFGTGSDLIWAVNGETFERHHTTLKDVGHAARVADALPNLDFIMSCAHPHEVEPQRAYLVEFWAMAQHSIKPIVNTAASLKDLTQIWEISRILRGGASALEEKPYWIHYAEPISPRFHPAISVDKLLFCAEKRMPVIYSPAPISGSTAPITIAGHVVQGLAESVFGLVLHQLAAPGAPFIMGLGPAVLDMATSECSYNAPEYLMALMAMVEMSKSYNIPNWGYAGTSDSQIPDGQAAFESGLLTFMSAMAGSNLNHDVGYLDFGRAGSLEMMVIQDEIIDQVRRMQQGVPVNAAQIALDVIREVGPQGEYLSHAHTFDHLRNTQWRAKLFSRKGYEAWAEEGGTTLLERAREKVNQILDDHAAPEVDSGLAEQIETLVEGYGR